MSAVVRIGAFALGVAVLFAVAALAGAQVDPEVREPAAEHGDREEVETMRAHDTHDGGTAATPPGLAVAQDGYRLVPEATELARDAAAYRFRIVDDDGATVRDFDVEHERRMHLIVVRRDLARFQHLHPRQLADGSWEAELDTAAGGVYRAYADFATGGRSLTLATDLFVPGDFAPEPLPPASAVADAGDGYAVKLAAATPKAGASTAARFAVTRGGRPVGAVEPYLGADGHLVALREHDLAFLHTHPEGEPGGAGPISFEVAYPTAGRYRLFLQFRHGGRVRTAAFTQEVADARAGGEEVSDGHR